jgi:hypothetical protein
LFGGIELLIHPTFRTIPSAFSSDFGGMSKDHARP